MNSANFHQSRLKRGMLYPFSGPVARAGWGYKLLCAFALILFANNHAWAYSDPLDMPAPMTEGVQYSLLLDVAKAGERFVAVGERGHILLSDDQAQSWYQAKVPSQAQLNAVFFVDVDYGWAVGEDAAILNTTDGGKSWAHQFDDRNADIMGPLLDVYFTDRLHGFAVGVFGKFFYTEDGGKSWQQDNERLDNIDEWHLHAITASERAIYIAGESGTAFRSNDKGQTWTVLNTEHEGSLFGIAARSGDFADEVIAFGVGGNLLVSSNGGEEWQSRETHTKLGLAGATWLDDGSFLIVGSDGVLVKGDASKQRKTPNLKTTNLKNRLPLSAVTQVGDDLVLVGIGGPRRMAIADLIADFSARLQESQ